MRYFRNNFLRMFAVSLVLIALAGCSVNGNQAGAATQNPINISETGQGFSIAEGKEQVMFYQRQHKSLDGKYTRANYIHPLYGLDGETISGYSLQDAKELIGNYIEHPAAWRNGTDVSPLSSRPIRLKFVMKDANLYSLQFNP